MSELKPIWVSFLAFSALIRAILSEIFDESAYQRYLARHALANSPSSYRGFLREASSNPRPKARCC